MTRWDCRTMFELYDQLRAEVYDGHARAWLVTPNASLGDRAPCELIETPAGYQRVMRTLEARLREAATEI